MSVGLHVWAADEAKTPPQTVVPVEPPAAAAPESSSSGFLAGSPSLIVEGEGASDYVFRGVNLGTELWAARAELVLPVGETTFLSLGGKYLNADSYEEAQGFAALTQNFGALRAALGYRFYGLDAGDRNEVGLLLGTTLSGFDVSLSYFYDAEFSGHYIELLTQREWKLFDPVSLRATAGLSASADYWYGNSGFNNALLRLDLPVSLRDWITLTPWIGASLPMEAIDDHEDDTLSGGVNLKLSF